MDHVGHFFGQRLDGLRPLVQRRQVHRDRDEEHGHERQVARGRLENAPRRERPGAAGQVLNHQHRERAERQADPEDVGDEVRLPDDARLDERLAEHQADRADRCGSRKADEAQEHRLAAEPAQFRRWPREQRRVVQRSVCVHGHDSAPSAGTAGAGVAAGAAAVPAALSFCSSSAGTSAVVALWLNCRARM